MAEPKFSMLVCLMIGRQCLTASRATNATFVQSVAAAQLHSLHLPDVQDQLKFESLSLSSDRMFTAPVRNRGLTDVKLKLTVMQGTVAPRLEYASLHGIRAR